MDYDSIVADMLRPYKDKIQHIKHHGTLADMRRLLGIVRAIKDTLRLNNIIEQATRERDNFVPIEYIVDSRKDFEYAAKLRGYAPNTKTPKRKHAAFNPCAIETSPTIRKAYKCTLPSSVVQSIHELLESL